MDAATRRLLIVGGGLALLLFGAYALLPALGEPKDAEEAAQHVDEPGAVYWEAPGSLLPKDEEAVLIPTDSGSHEVLRIKDVLFEYVEVTEGCAEHFAGECVNVRSGPGTDFPVVARLRNHQVLKVGGKVEREGKTWIRIVFDETLRYPERVTSDWYVLADYVRVVLDAGDQDLAEGVTASSTKRIVVDRSEQSLVAYDGDTVFLKTPVSTGLELTPTPRGSFTVFKKTPSRYMQGPAPGLPPDYYDLPGVPWNLYFTHEGAVIHGAYWHNSFGTQYSHGCVNLPPATAKTLYDWAELGTVVVVED